MDKYRFEQKRKILTLILTWSLALSIVGLSINLVTLLLSVHNIEEAYGKGVGVFPLFASVFLFSYLLYLSKRGKIYVSSLICVSYYSVAAVYLSLRWGIDIPQGLLIYTLVIVTSWILLGTKTSYIITLSIILITFLLTYLNINNVIQPNVDWKFDFIDYRDALIYSVTFSIIALVSWLSNREIERSLAKAAASEQALRAERDSLEVKVAARTKELQALQMEQMQHVYRFAEFGKLAAGLMHDIVNPLTVVSINLEHLYSKSAHSNSKEIKSLKQIMKRAIDSTSRIENYVDAARKQIQQQNIKSSFNLCEELEGVRNLFAYRCRHEGVNMLLKCDRTAQLYGNQVKFSQVISNIVGNALDAHQQNGKEEKKFVNISVDISNTDVHIHIQDNGPGIPPHNLSKLFDPFYTTKSAETGTGLGLSMAREVIESEFGGTILVQSTLRKGTTFSLAIPLKKQTTHASGAS